MLSLVPVAFLLVYSTKGESLYLHDDLIGPVVFIVGSIGLLLIWYFRGRRHRAMLTELTPLFDEHSGEMQVARPIRGGEDRAQGHYGGRDVLFSVKEPVQGYESSLFRLVLGSRMTTPFVISVQKRMLFGIVSQVQRGRAVKTGNRNMDKNYYVTDLMALTSFDLFQRLFGSSKTSKDLQDNLQKRLISWLLLPGTFERFETLFRSCGVDYLATRIEYPGKIELPASKSGLTAVLRHYSRRQLRPENIKRILGEMDSLLRSAESFLEPKPTQQVS